jgi:putative ABC transport system permease protein
MTVLIGSMIEAWDELRIHKLRVLLSLIGVSVAVAAMTGVLAIGQMLGQANTEMMQKWNGRDAMVYINGAFETEGTQTDVTAIMKGFAERFEVQYSSRVVQSWNAFQTSTGPMETELTLVDSPYQVMHNLKIVSGSWFGDGDAQRLAPAVVVNEAYLRETGMPKDLSVQTGLALQNGGKAYDLVVIGVVPDEWPDEHPRIWMLVDSYLNVFANDPQAIVDMYPSLELWLDPQDVQNATDAAYAYFKPYVRDENSMDVWDNTNSMGQQDNFMSTFQTIVLGVGTVILGIGALSLVNISLVTVQQRIREIGIRRAFGATTGRVFFSIMMESVVATFMAGLIGVVLAVIVVGQIPVVEMLMGQEIENPPGFPTGAAVTGILVATGIGALSGLIPGLVATRIKPIEAMRA